MDSPDGRTRVRKQPGTYEEAVCYIENIPKFTEKHTLEHTKEFIRRLGDPGSDRKIIHVAGTNGKGSVCAYIQAILEKEGKRTGFFTSPHLVKINERIQIGRIPLDDEQFYEVFLEVFRVVCEMEEEKIDHPSYFEFLYGMGMKAFSDADVEYIILETGLGGRLDATNASESPAVTVITSISLDHTDILGETIEEVAREKAGIIKKGVPVFFDGTDRGAAEVIKEAAKRCGAPCREITKNAFEIREVNRKYIAFSRPNAYDRGIKWQVPLCGIYQVMNAEIAIEAAEYLLRGEKPREALWPEVVGSICWKGRMEEAGEHLVIDGAHNPGAIKAFIESVQALGERTLPVVVFAVAADKKYEKMIEYLCRDFPAKAYIATEIEDKRRVPAETVGHIFRRYTKQKVLVREKPEEALQAAYEERSEGGFIYCLGSLYLAGQIEKILAGGTFHAEL